MATPWDIPRYKKGQLYRPEAAHLNAVTDACRRLDVYERGVSDEASYVAAKNSTSQERYMTVFMHGNIPRYAIFTIQAGGDFSYSKPIAKSKQIDSSAYNVLIASDTRNLPEGSFYKLPIVDMWHPHIYKYYATDGVPVINETVGPSPNRYDVSAKKEGLIVVSKPDTDAELVWCVGAGGGRVANLFIGEVITADIAPNSTGEIEQKDKDGLTGDTHTVRNISDVTFEVGMQVFAFTGEGYDEPLIYPFEFTECIDPPPDSTQQVPAP